MNIDDILAEAGAGGQAEAQESRDLQELTRAWVTERSGPEILPWPESLMERVLKRIHEQVRFKSCVEYDKALYSFLLLFYRLSW